MKGGDLFFLRGCVCVCVFLSVCVTGCVCQLIPLFLCVVLLCLCLCCAVPVPVPVLCCSALCFACVLMGVGAETSSRSFGGPPCFSMSSVAFPPAFTLIDASEGDPVGLDGVRAMFRAHAAMLLTIGVDIAAFQGFEVWIALLPRACDAWHPLLAGFQIAYPAHSHRCLWPLLVCGVRLFPASALARRPQEAG